MRDRTIFLVAAGCLMAAMGAVLAVGVILRGRP